MKDTSTLRLLTELLRRSLTPLYHLIVYTIILLLGAFTIATAFYIIAQNDPSMMKYLPSTSKTVWDILSSIGSLLAGLGTIGLLIFGYVTADTWKQQTAHDIKVKTSIELSRSLYYSVNDFCRYLKGVPISPVSNYITERGSMAKRRKDQEQIFNYTNEIFFTLNSLKTIYDENSDLLNELKRYDGQVYAIVTQLTKGKCEIEGRNTLSLLALDAQKITYEIFAIEILGKR